MSSHFWTETKLKKASDLSFNAQCKTNSELVNVSMAQNECVQWLNKNTFYVFGDKKRHFFQRLKPLHVFVYREIFDGLKKD